ncbi:MAG: hypothetical protein EHM17_11935 [Verrucomicrobiaceae bacterium]|nr:MAG: hypothetical protein EHM17_11935 [Verrucomicrobiaceae bacterium]
MHRLPSSSAIRRIRLAALLLGAICLITPAAAGVLVYSIMNGDKELAMMGTAMIILVGLVVLMQWVIATRATCPLCLAPVLSARGCVKHRNARTFLGSHRIRVALAVLFRNQFRCPFCGEPTVLKVRERKTR